ncbi:replicative DNA helicase [Formivibrio citricus]|uniref:Replicative DNA helicase n=1 Tax=Formivibrio citricus TaxID=83765 RepID=A0A1I4Y4D8_9NEIS|nr:replicative DNA helicase [Formivibrio citricus]SFN32951.1 replicative DNA helicase [Formivibrio citricus]
MTDHPTAPPDVTQPENFRLPPHSVEAEQSVLGGLLLDNPSFDKIADVIGASDFYRDDHRRIFNTICNLIEHNRPADVITVAEALDSTNELAYVGGLAYLGSLAQNTPSAANIRRYAEIVREKSVMRQLASVATDIADGAYNPNGREARDLLDEAETKVFQIAEQSARGQKGFIAMPPILKEIVARIDHLYQQEDQGDVTGIATGFIDLDRMTSGLQKGDLIIVAGRPSMGKTAFSINIAEHVAIEGKLPVAVFSMEMGAAQLGMRMVGSVGKIDMHKLKTGRFEDEDWTRLTHAVSRLSEAPIFIEETGALTAMDIRTKSRRLARQCGGQLGLIVIDYMQLMAGRAGARDQNRATELGEISRSLKGLAKELQVPIIALSQLSRSVEQRTDKRPMMSDLRESGAIEQDADLIMFMYRDEYYNPDSAFKGLAECIVGKHRNGPTGKVPLVFQGQFSRFDNALMRPEGWSSDLES